MSNDTDLEAALRVMLRERATDIVAVPSELTGLDIDAVRNPAPRVGRIRWLPWLAAAVVATIAVTASLLFGSPARHQPATSPTPSVPTPTAPPPTRSSSTPSPTRTYSTPTRAPAPSLGPALAGTVTLGDAVLPLPPGWAAHTVTGNRWPTWCIARIGVPTPTKLTACLAWFQQIPPGAPGAGLDPDIETGSSRPTLPAPDCGGYAHGATSHLLAYGERSFGGRPADYRQWRWDCPGGTRVAITQYLIATAPGYLLYSDHADPTTQTMMASLAAGSTLPAQNLPLRYHITGTVQALSHHGDGYHVTLQPVVRTDDGQYTPISGMPATQYVIPDHLVPPGLQGNLAGPISLQTNGRVVTLLTIIGG